MNKKQNYDVFVESFLKNNNLLNDISNREVELNKLLNNNKLLPDLEIVLFNVNNLKSEFYENKENRVFLETMLNLAKLFVEAIKLKYKLSKFESILEKENYNVMEYNNIINEISTIVIDFKEKTKKENFEYILNKMCAVVLFEEKNKLDEEINKLEVNSLFNNLELTNNIKNLKQRENIDIEDIKKDFKNTCKKFNEIKNKKPIYVTMEVNADLQNKIHNIVLALKKVNDEIKQLNLSEGKEEIIFLYQKGLECLSKSDEVKEGLKILVDF
jgi:hypothetical protein